MGRPRTLGPSWCEGGGARRWGPFRCHVEVRLEYGEDVTGSSSTPLDFRRRQKGCKRNFKTRQGCVGTDGKRIPERIFRSSL